MEGEPDIEQLRLDLRNAGIDPRSVPDAEPVAVWPENWAPLMVFLAARTQWQRVGMSGALVGMRYEVLPELWRRCGVKKRDRDDCFHALRTMENEALQVAAEKADD